MIPHGRSDDYEDEMRSRVAACRKRLRTTRSAKRSRAETNANYDEVVDPATTLDGFSQPSFALPAANDLFLAATEESVKAGIT